MRNELDTSENGALKKAILKINKKVYRQDLKLFIEYLDLNNLGLNFEAVKSYLQYLEEEGYEKNGKRYEYTAGTFNRKVIAIKEGIRFVFKISPDGIDLNRRYKLEQVLNEIKLKKINSKEVNRDLLLSKEEVETLIENTSEKLGLIILFLYSTGTRISEMIGVKLSNIAERERYYEIRIVGKGRKERKIKAKKGLVEKIISHFQSKQYLFETVTCKKDNRGYVSMEIKKAGWRILRKDISAHTLRHSFATRMIDEGKSIKGVSKYLGHSNVSTTLELYVHSELEWEALEDIADV